MIFGFALIASGATFFLAIACTFATRGPPPDYPMLAAIGGTLGALGVTVTLLDARGTNVGRLVGMLRARYARPRPPSLRFWKCGSATPPPRLDPLSLRRWLTAEIADDGRTHNLNLCGCSLENIDLGAKTKTERPQLRGLIFGLEGSSRPNPAKLTGARFSRAVLRECRFANVNLDRVDLSECELIDCDLRYAQFRNARLGHVKFVRCDMYGASLQPGTIATGVQFRWSTLPELVGGITGFEWESFQSHDRVPAVAGEDARMYASLLERTHEDRPKAAISIAEAIDDRLQGAAAAYRKLSGYWNTQGRYLDANLAYVHSKRLERKAAGPWYAATRRWRGEGSFRKVPLPDGRLQPAWRQREEDLSWRQRLVDRRRFRPLRWAWLWIADAVSCFGQSLRRVLIALVLVAFLPALAYRAWGGVEGSQGIDDDLLFSASHLTAFRPEHLKYATVLAEWLGIAQSAIAIGLVGLFGYVLGNALRQS